LERGGLVFVNAETERKRYSIRTRKFLGEYLTEVEESSGGDFFLRGLYVVR